MKRIIETHGDALRLALRGLNEHIELLESDISEGNFWAGGGVEERARQVLQNYRDARDAIENDMLPEEERWEQENGFSDENGKRIRKES